MRFASKSKKISRKFVISLFAASTVAIVSVNTFMTHVNSYCDLSSIEESQDGLSTQPTIGYATTLACLNASNKINWLVWLATSPETMQFHYLDFIELINRER